MQAGAGARHARGVVMLAGLGAVLRRRELGSPPARLVVLAACHCATHLVDAHKNGTRTFSADHGVVELSDQGEGPWAGSWEWS